MKEENKKEEIQSRREFFKNAAKKGLPIVAAIALAGMPAISKAESEPTNCKYEACVGGCYHGCYGGCTDNCTSCHNGCKGGCKDICTGCHNGCSGSCKSSSGR